MLLLLTLWMVLSQTQKQKFLQASAVTARITDCHAKFWIRKSAVENYTSACTPIAVPSFITATELMTTNPAEGDNGAGANAVASPLIQSRSGLPLLRGTLASCCDAIPRLVWTEIPIARNTVWTRLNAALFGTWVQIVSQVDADMFTPVAIVHAEPSSI